MNYKEKITQKSKSTRRDYVKYCGTLMAGSLVSGCIGGSDSGSSNDGSSNKTERSSSDNTSYSVTMAPMGEVEFDSIPETWIPYSGDYADMAVTLGKTDGITGIGSADRYYTYVYEELPGVSIDRDKIEKNPEVRNKEQFYELDSDVHFYDTEMLVNWFDWDRSDIKEIKENVGPFIGNLIFRREDEWHDYKYYTLYEAFEKIAQVFKEEKRYKEFKDLHDSFIKNIKKKLPPTSDRPEVLLTFEGTDEPETFSPYRLDDMGTSKKQWRDLGVKDVLSDTGIEGLSTTERGELDYETLLELDPDVLLVRGHERKSVDEFRNVVLEYMRNHPVGSELTAVKNGRVYRGGYLYQGPIHNLFLTERGAKQIYPDIFDDVTSDRRLFDRQRVADIVNGNF